MKNKIIKRIITFVLTTMLTLTTTPVAAMPVYAQGEPVTPTNTVTLSPSVGILRVPATGDVVINDTNFPNANFRAWICSTYGKNDGDTLTATTIAAIININVSNNDIADLTGIEHFTALTTLNCSYNQLTELGTLPNSLTYLNCGRNQLAELGTLPTSRPRNPAG